MKAMCIPIKDWAKFMKGIKISEAGTLVTALGLAVGCMGMLMSRAGKTWMCEEIPSTNDDIQAWGCEFSKEVETETEEN